MSAQAIPIHRRGITLLIALVLFTLAVYTLEKTGAGRSIAIYAAGAAVFAMWLITSIEGGTTQPQRYLFLDRNVRAGINGVLITVIGLVPFAIIDGGGMFFTNPSLFIVCGAAVTTGIAGSGLFMARRLRTAERADFCDTMVAGFANPLPARIASLVLLAGGCLMGAAAIAATVRIAGWFFELTPATALVAVAIAIIVPIVMGGFSSITRMAAVSGIALIAGVNLLLLFQALSAGGLPIGHLTFGISALEPIRDLEAQLQQIGIPELREKLVELPEAAGWNISSQIAVAVLIAVGLCFSPITVQPYIMASGPARANSAAVKAILTSAFLFASVVAVYAFTKAGIYQLILGMPLSEALYDAPVLYSWGASTPQLITVCGAAVAQAAQLIQTCGGDPERILTIQDIAIDSRLLLPAAADLAGFGLTLTALITSATLLALIAFAAITFQCVTSNLISAWYMTLPGRLETGRLFFNRLTGLAIVLAVTGFVASSEIDPFTWMTGGIGLIVSVFPAAAIALSNRRIFSALPVTLAIASGILATLTVFILSSHGMDLTASTGDEFAMRLPGITEALDPVLSGLLGLVASLTILALRALFRSARGRLSTATAERA